MTTIERIRMVSKEKGISLSFLCTKMNVARVYFNDIEKYKRDIPDDKLRIIAETLDVSLDYLKGTAPRSSFALTADEQQVLDAYRSHPELHAVIRKLLDVPEPQSEDGAVS